MATAFHTHFHKRHKKKVKKSFIDRLVVVAVIGGPIFTLPQAYEVWFRESEGVSLLSWSSYLVFNFIWLAYGIKHKEKPIILAEIIWIILDVIIILGILVR